MTDQCLFCRIAAHESPAHVLYEDELLMAFLVLCPVRPGHALIIPRQHFDYFDALPEGVITPILRLGQELAAAMKALYGVPRVGFLFTGGDVPHAHAHVVPLHEKEDITSQHYIAERDLTFREAPRMPDPELAAVARDLVRTLGQQS
jgi:histidine triad (HIT) family protein